MQRHLRLQRREDFDRLRAHGQIKRHAFLILSVIPSDLPHNRYGFITGKPLGNAVVRNRVRRLMREAVRQAHPGVRVGYDMAFIARKPIVGQSFQAVSQAIHHCLRQAGLWVSPEGELPS